MYFANVLPFQSICNLNIADSFQAAELGVGSWIARSRLGSTRELQPSLQGRPTSWLAYWNFVPGPKTPVVLQATELVLLSDRHTISATDITLHY